MLQTSVCCPKGTNVQLKFILVNANDFSVHISKHLFTNSPEDLGSILGRVISKTLKMVLDTALLKIHHYKVRIKGKVEQSR